MSRRPDRCTTPFEWLVRSYSRKDPSLGFVRVAHPDTERDAPSDTGSRIQSAADRGVEANARRTGSTAAVLLVLLAAEGLTILRVGRLLTWHVFLGMMLVPPVLLARNSSPLSVSTSARVAVLRKQGRNGRVGVDGTDCGMPVAIGDEARTDARVLCREPEEAN
jgi:hypothetical protein